MEETVVVDPKNYPMGFINSTIAPRLESENVTLFNTGRFTTTKEIKNGEQILWHYGTAYGDADRSYTVRGHEGQDVTLRLGSVIEVYWRRGYKWKTIWFPGYVVQFNANGLSISYLDFSDGKVYEVECKKVRAADIVSL